MKKLAIFVALTVALGASNAFALRCGLNLASEGDLKQEVLVACGEPVRKEEIGYIDEERRGDRIRVLKLEEWIYELNGYFYSLTFEGNVLKKIERAGEKK